MMLGLVGGAVLFGLIGFFITYKLNISLIEKIIYTLTLSIALSTLISLLLAYIGILTLWPLIISYVVVSIIIILVMRKKR